MAISRELEIGKAGEHFVCCDLIKNGLNAFLSDAGLNYDVLVDYNGKIYKMQVKSTKTLISTSKSENIYRFGLKTGKKSVDPYGKEIDIYAFVALDINCVAYLTKEELFNPKTEKTKQCIEFLSKLVDYGFGRTYSNGTKRKKYGKFIQDFPINRIFARQHANG